MDVLFVDDDSEDREFFVDALSYVDASLKCEVAANCDEASLKLKESVKTPSYIFLDIHMPVAGGKHCLQSLIKNPEVSNSKIVMYSGVTDENIIREYKAMGANYFLIKPASFDELCDSLSIMFGKN